MVFAEIEYHLQHYGNYDTISTFVNDSKGDRWEIFYYSDKDVYFFIQPEGHELQYDFVKHVVKYGFSQRIIELRYVNRLWC